MAPIGTCSGQEFGENRSDFEEMGLLLDKKIKSSRTYSLQALDVDVQPATVELDVQDTVTSFPDSVQRCSTESGTD